MESLLNIYLGVNQVPEEEGSGVITFDNAYAFFRQETKLFEKQQTGGGDAQLAIANVTLGPIKSENVGNVIDLSSSRPLFPLFSFMSWSFLIESLARQEF
jgi:hypothetical protein